VSYRGFPLALCPPIGRRNDLHGARDSLVRYDMLSLMTLMTATGVMYVSARYNVQASSHACDTIPTPAGDE